MAIVFTLAINFVNGIGIFISASSGVDVSGGTDITGNGVLYSLTGLSGGMEYIWGLFTIVGVGIAFVLARAFGSTTIIGVWFFSEVFWTSYMRAMMVINVNNFLVDMIGMDFVIMFTAGLIFIWVGAIISMFTNVS